MVIKNSVSNYFLSTFVDSIHVFDCRLSGVSILVYITVVAIGASFKVNDMFCFFVVVVDMTLVFIAFVVIVFKIALVLVAAIFVLVLKEDKDKKLWLQFQILFKTVISKSRETYFSLQIFSSSNKNSYRVM